MKRDPQPPAPLTTIREVAKRAGVSLGTVSHVLNRPEIVRPALRERVQKVIAEVGYRPNAVAKSLSEGRTKTIGLILSDITTPFASKVARAVEALAVEADMSVVFADTDEKIGLEERAVHTFFDKGVDGLIVAPAPGDHKFLAAYLQRGLPVVAINRSIERSGIPSVLSDNVAGAAHATGHLIAHGHRRIGIVAPLTSPASVKERIRGYEKQARAAGLDVAPALVAADEGSVQGGSLATQRLLRLDPRPTAILSLSSAMSLGVIVALHEAGVRVPDEIALIGFDEAQWSVAVSPPLTSVDLRAEVVGETATRLLLDWIRHRTPPEQPRIRIPTRLIVRRSCGGGADQGG